MNCRARAEGLARRLQAKVRLGNGGGSTSAFEQTSLVSPGPGEDHYASMECRHGSLDDPRQLGRLLEEASLRPIHVVTSEPTLHLCLPPPPHCPLQEQDSDVYYDFDLASPEVPDGREEGEEGEGEGEAEGRRDEGGERPESGCVTSVTSPIMFEDEAENELEEDLPGSPGDLGPVGEALASSPDADLRAVRQILSSSSLSDAPALPDLCDRPSERVSVDVESAECDNESECDASRAQVRAGGREGTGPWAREGAGCTPDTCPLPAEPVVSSAACCSCDAGPPPDPCVARVPGAPPAPSPPSSVSSVCERCGDGGETCSASPLCVMINNEGHIKDDEGQVEGIGEGQCHVTRVTLRRFEAQLAVPREEENGPREAESVVLRATAATIPAAISGSPPSTPPHLYSPSEEDPPAMEAREDEAGLQVLGGEVNEDQDDEVIETLAEDESGEEEENATEEDVEEETILTGRFRNIRGYRERVRRLSDEIEDRPFPVSVVYYDQDSPPVPEDNTQEEQRKEDEVAVAVEEVQEQQPLSQEELTQQLCELKVEDVGVQVDTEDGEASCEEEVVRSSSEEPETDPEQVEDYKMRIKRSSSLKCGKTPPGTPGRKKIVRFADMLGLDLAAVRTFLGGGIPHVPRSAFWDLQVEKQSKQSLAMGSGIQQAQSLMPRRVLTPLFQQPGSQLNFLERVRHQRVVLESVDIGDDLSVRGMVRVLNLDFHKSVIVRYTFDNWRNFHEATATYLPGSYDGLTDRFSFLLWGSFLQDNAALIFCVRYHTLNQEFWDNNYDRNYSLQCYTTSGRPGECGPDGAGRPQNSSSVQQHFSNFSVGSPTTPHDPWINRFF